MKRTILALAIASISIAAFAGPPVQSVSIANTPLPVAVVTSDVVPLGDLRPAIRRLCSAALGQCESLVPVEEPLALYEVHFALAPSDPIAPDGVQCWIRVRIADDRMTFREIAKFSWPANDFHGVIHSLPFPIGLQPSQDTILQLIVGSNLADPGEFCDTEIKVYTRKN